MPTAKADLGEDITLRTDGRRSLHVWFGPRLVYSSGRLSLRIDPPLQPYLEVQGMRIGYVSTFTDFSVARDSNLTVRGLLPGEGVALMPTGGRALRAVASSSGEARFALPLPGGVSGTGTLTLLREGALMLGPFSYAGGEFFRVTSPSRRAGG